MGIVIDNESLKSDGELIELILGTESMDDAERKEWLTNMPTLAQEQKDRLLTILKDEKRKLEELDKNFTKEQKALDFRHSKEKIEKIHELLAIKKYKLNEEEINIGIDAVQTYIDDESTKSKNLLAKSAFILEYAIKNIADNDTKKAAFHYWASDVYMKYPMPEKMNERIFHLSQSIKYLKKMYAANGEPSTKESISLLLESLSYLQVCKKDFQAAIKSVDEAVSNSKKYEIEALINKAHALVFLDNELEAAKLYRKVINSNKKNEALKDIESDLREFERLKFPTEKIKTIRSLVHSNPSHRDKSISIFKAKIEAVKKTKNDRLLSKMQEALKCYEDKEAMPDSKIDICEDIFLNKQDQEFLNSINDVEQK